MTTKYRIRWEEFLIGERSIEADSEEELKKKFAHFTSSAKTGWTRSIIEGSERFEVVHDERIEEMRTGLKNFSKQRRKEE